MVQIVKIVILVLWLPQAVRQLLIWIYWWQVKEYRLDRFKELLKSAEARKKLELEYISFKLLLLFLSLLSQIFVLPLALLLIIPDARFAGEVLFRKLRRPAFTQRAFNIFSTGLVIITLCSVLSLYFIDKLYLFVLTGEISLLMTPYIGILWTTLIVEKVKKEEIVKAEKVLKNVKPTVIGVTGSYGKSSTKEFIAHLLSQKYPTAKTSGSENTVFGIARKTVAFVKSASKFFVVEMGAYKRGEIKELANMVRPSVGVITGIEEQHLSLFGSLENIKKTKFELIESLPEGGVAIFNLSNKGCRELAGWAKKSKKKLKVMGYSLSKNREGTRTDINARILSANTDGVTFEVKEKDKKIELFAAVKGVHFIENLTCAILISRLFRVNWSLIKSGCETVSPLENTMQVFELKDGAVVIDDSYNSTPVGFKAALSYLSLFKRRKKAVITAGIIELGKISNKVHSSLGKLAGKTTDKIVLINPDFEESFGSGLDKKKQSLLRVISDTKCLEEEALRLIKDKYVILIEGKIPVSIVKTFERYRYD